MWDVFLSYNRANTATMCVIRDYLKNHGLKVWSDEKVIPGTPAWSETLENIIENCWCVVVILTKEAKKSRWVKREIQYAEAQEVYTIPLLAHDKEQDSVPITLISHQRIDMRFDQKKGLEKLLTTVSNRISIGILENGDISKDTPPFPQITAYEHIKIGDLVNFHKVEQIHKKDQKQGKYPLYSVTGIQNYIDIHQFSGDYLIIPSIISVNSPTAFMVEDHFSATTSVFVVTPNETIMAEYLVYILEHIGLHQYATDITMPRINKSTLKSIEIPVPPLDEQKQLVDYLSQMQQWIENAQGLHQQILSDLDLLMPSVVKAIFKDVSIT